MGKVAVSLVWLMFLRGVFAIGPAIIDCNAGYYSAIVCVKCSPGKYADAFGKRTGCASCGIGTYSGSGATTCTECGFGTSSVWIEATACFGCTAGSVATTKTACTQCSPGSYSIPLTTACTSCQAGKYNPYWNKDSCQDCYPGSFSETQAAACSNCPVGKYSTAVRAITCASCLMGAYSFSEGTTQCTLCSPGSFAASNGMSVCSPCPQGSYCSATGMSSHTPCPSGSSCSSPLMSSFTACPSGTLASSTGQIECTNCAAGTFSARESSACSLCVAGKFSQVKAASCQACASGTYSALGGSSSCVFCEKGTYAGNDGLSTCTDCMAGSFSSAIGTVTCASCTNSINYASSTRSTACNSCSACDPMSQYEHTPCTAALNTMCCNNIIDTGKYATSCNGVATCPVLTDGLYTNSNSRKLNRCDDFTCNQGYFSPKSELAKAGTTCQTSNYVMNASCASFMSNICIKSTICVNGVNTELRNYMDASIINPLTGDIQCTSCQPCMPGTVQISQCTTTTQTVCATCPSFGIYASFPWNGKCMYYDNTPGAMTLSQTPIGYFPYMLTFSSSLVSAIQNNSISYPTKNVVSFTLDPSSYSMTTEELTTGSGFSVNIFIPCATPPLGRRFKAWSGFKAKGAPVTCTSVTECANFHATCDQASSTECIGWDNALKTGWYALNPSECTLCPSNSSYSTCDWGFYRNLSDCMPDRVSGCFPCHGTLPPNAVWTTSKYPHHFDDSEPEPCEWDCDKGYYKDSGVCKSCTKPENSEFDYGPFIAFGNADPPPKTCLHPEMCKYFGGVKGFSCAWRCPNGFSLTLPQFGVGDPRCDPCPTITCSPDEIAVFVDTCNRCQKCGNIVDNAVYQAGCTFTCADGYFLLNATYCKRCTTKTCLTGQYSGGCGESSDSTCLSCSVCSVGYSVSAPCNATSDTACIQCTADLIPYSTYNSSCAVVCISGYVMSGGQCTLCAASDANCKVGQRKAATCTAQNLGCEACVVPQTTNWCWSGSGLCSWDCGPRYRKINGACVADATKTANPCIGDVFVAVTTPGVTSPLVISGNLTATLVVTQKATTPDITAPFNFTPVFTSDDNATTNTTPGETTSNATLQAIMRETLSIANMSIHECTCASALMANELGKAHGTQVFSVACEAGELVVLCVNFSCPCAATRRLLQANATRYKYVRRKTLLEVSKEQLTEAVQAAVPAARVVASEIVKLGEGAIAWDDSLSTRTHEAAVDVVTAIIISVVALFSVTIVVTLAYLRFCKRLARSRVIYRRLDQ